MTNDDMMTGGGEGVKDNKRTLLKLSMMFFGGGRGYRRKKSPCTFGVMYQKKEYWHSEWSQVAKGL